MATGPGVSPSRPVLSEAVDVAFHRPVRSLGRSDGLPSGQVHSVSTDSLGRLWMATPNGLAVADGSRVTTYTRADGLSTQGLRCVAVAPDDVVWVGSDVGVDRRLPDGRIESLVGGWRWGLVADIAIGRDGSTWVASARGLMTWTNDAGWVREPHGGVDDDPLYRVALDSDTVWVLSRQHGVLVRRSGAWGVAARADDPHIGVLQCIAAGDGTAVVGGSKGAVRLDPDGGGTRPIAGVVGAIQAVHVNRSQLWLASATELLAFGLRDDTWQPLGMVVPSVRINRITHDLHGNVWAASDSAGVVEIEAVGDALIRPILPVGSVFCVRPMGDGSMLVAGDTGTGVLELSTSPQFAPISALVGERVWDIIDDRRGGYWAATDRGLCHVSGQYETGSARLGADDPVLAAPGRALLRRGDDLWVGTLNGLAVVAPDSSVRTIGDRTGMSLGYVYTLTGDGDTVWIGTLGNGLWRVGHHGAERVGGTGLVDTGNTYAVAVRTTGTVVVLQDDRIVSIAPDQPSRVTATTREALAGWSATFDDDGHLWVGGTNGLTQYSPGGERRCAVTLWMGLEGWEFTTSRALVGDRHGRLFCGLSSGLVVVDRRAIEELAQYPPTVELADLTWSGVEARELEPNRWEVPEGGWSLSAKVYSTFPFTEASTLFRYRLLGLQQNWSEPTRSAAVSFDRLTRGGYTIEAQAYSELAGWGPSATLATIDVVGLGVVQRWLGRLRSARALRRLAAENHGLEQLVRDRVLELERTQIQLEEANQALVRLSYSDQLTGAANRRHLVEEMRRSLARSERTRSPLSVLVIDVDEFKPYNDEYGHVAGDECLREITIAMSNSLRVDLDLLARYGGEEFVAVLPDTDSLAAASVAERVRTAVQDRALPHARSAVCDVVSISVGCATMMPGVRRTSEELIAAADRALYQAKTSGRNRVCVAVDSQHRPGDVLGTVRRSAV